MVRSDGKRDIALIENGAETSVFAGTMQRQAAMKAARRRQVVGPTEATVPRTELRLRERGTDTVHVDAAWTWTDPASVAGLAWLGDTVTEANVSKQGVEHRDT